MNYRSEIASPLDRVGLVAERRGEAIDVTPRKQAEDIAASQEMLPVIDLITEMTGRVLGSGLVIPDKAQKNAVRRLIRAFLAGAGVEDPETAKWSQRRVQVATGIGFQPTGGGKAAITGDFVMIGEEVNPVIKALRAGGIEITALHSHMLDEQPRLYFMHFWANDDAIKLAKGLRAAIDKTASKTN